MLSDAKTRAARPRPKPYKLTDSNQLFLLVTPSGGKLWRWNYKYDGKQRCMAFGPILSSRSRMRVENAIEVGRQLVGLGSERLVGTRYGPNTPLAFDGARAIADHGALTASLFYLVPVDAGPGSFDDRRSRSRVLSGLYATRWFGADLRARVDFYYLSLWNDRQYFEQGVGREVRHTLGLRSAGRANMYHWDMAIRQLKLPDLTTTVLTLTITGIGADSKLAGGVQSNRSIRFAAVGAIFAGAAVGAILVLRWGLAPPLLLAGLIVLTGTILCARDDRGQETRNSRSD